MSHLIDPGSVFVVIPACNEHSTIRTVAEEILPYQYQLVVVDDGSVPELLPALKGLPLTFLRHRVNLGQGAALRTGIEYALSAHADYIVTFDADGQHQAADIPRLLEQLQKKNADIVSGSRFLEGSEHNMSLARMILLQAARYLNFLVTGLMLSDAHNGLRAMTRHAAEHIQIREHRMAHATEILSIIRRQKLRHAEVPVRIRYTDYSRRKGQSIWSGFRIFFDLLLNKLFK